jgi:hypothetical protein
VIDAYLTNHPRLNLWFLMEMLLGKLNHRSGNRGQAEEHLSTATAMYREMEHGVLAAAGCGGNGPTRIATTVGQGVPGRLAPQ